jgi:BMFP domain-containing protein YqiC
MQDNALNREQQRNNSLVNRIEKDSQQVRGAYESIRSENIELTDRVEELEAKVTEFKLKFEYAQKQLTTD